MDATAATPVLLVLVLALPLLALLLLRSSSSRQGGPLRRIRTLLLLLWKERDGDPRAPFHADGGCVNASDFVGSHTPSSLILSIHRHTTTTPMFHLSIPYPPWLNTHAHQHLHHATAVLILGGDRDRELCALALVHARELHQHDDDGPAMVMDYDRAPVIVSSGAVGPEDLAAAVAMARGGGSGEEAEAEAIQELRKRVVWDRRAVCTGTGGVRPN